MKTLKLVIIFFFISGISLAQSKKEIIAILTNRVDSLNQIVASELSDKQKLNIEISKLKNQIKDLERNNENLSNDKSALETKNNTLNKQLKIKQDSLVLVATELLKYRTAPKKELVVKQDNTDPIKTVTIGRQVWMLENLSVSTFKNGVAIPEIQYKDTWKKAGENQQTAWCYYSIIDYFDNDQNEYGKLYNWYAVMDTNGLCPQGWHVPSDAEWDTLVAYLGGVDVAGAKMKAKPVMKKEVGYYETGGYYATKSCNNCYTASAEYKKICPVCKGVGYVKTNKFIPKGKEKYIHEEQIGGWNGINESGFTGLPGGYRDGSGDYSYVGYDGYWWSSSEYEAYGAWGRALNTSAGNANRNDYLEENGLSVRCLRD